MERCSQTYLTLSGGGGRTGPAAERLAGVNELCSKTSAHFAKQLDGRTGGRFYGPEFYSTVGSTPTDVANAALAEGYVSDEDDVAVLFSEANAATQTTEYWWEVSMVEGLSTAARGGKARRQAVSQLHPGDEQGLVNLLWYKPHLQAPEGRRATPELDEGEAAVALNGSPEWEAPEGSPQPPEGEAAEAPRALGRGKRAHILSERAAAAAASPGRGEGTGASAAAAQPRAGGRKRSRSAALEEGSWNPSQQGRRQPPARQPAVRDFLPAGPLLYTLPAHGYEDPNVRVPVQSVISFVTMTYNEVRPALLWCISWQPPQAPSTHPPFVPQILC